MIKPALWALMISLFPLLIAPATAQMCGGGEMDGLVGYWNFDEGSGDTAHDVSGNGLDGTITGASWISGHVGSGALSFGGHGSNDHVIAPAPFDTEPESFTMSAWFRPEGWGENQSGVIAELHVGTSTRAHIRMLNGGGEEGLRAFVRLTGSPDISIDAPGVPVTFGAWHHVALVVENDRSESRLYLNGVEIGQGLGASATNTMVSGAQTQIGRGNLANRRFEGAIDEVMIFDHALSASEVQKLMVPGEAGDMLYNPDHGTIQWCDGEKWIGLPKSNYPIVQFQAESDPGNPSFVLDSPVPQAGEWVYIYVMARRSSPIDTSQTGWQHVISGSMTGGETGDTYQWAVFKAEGDGVRTSWGVGGLTTHNRRAAAIYHLRNVTGVVTSAQVASDTGSASNPIIADIPTAVVDAGDAVLTFLSRRGQNDDDAGFSTPWHLDAKDVQAGGTSTSGTTIVAGHVVAESAGSLDGHVSYNRGHNWHREWQMASIVVQGSADGSGGGGINAPCEPDEAGDMLYNADHAVVQWCDGTQWVGAPKSGEASALLVGHDESDVYSHLGMNGGSWPAIYTYGYTAAQSGVSSHLVLYGGNSQPMRVGVYDASYNLLAQSDLVLAPPADRPHIFNLSEPVVVTEGQTYRIALMQRGYSMIERDEDHRAWQLSWQGPDDVDFDEPLPDVLSGHTNSHNMYRWRAFLLGVPQDYVNLCEPEEAGDLLYNIDHAVIQWCDGTQWIGFPKEGSDLEGMALGAGWFECISAIENVPMSASSTDADRDSMGASLSGAHKWQGAVLAPNGNIYAIPFTSNNVLVIDPSSGSASRTNFGTSMSNHEAFAGGVLGPDGNIYGIPYRSTEIMIIDPDEGTLTLTDMGADLSGNNKWVGAVVGTDGKIYGIPWDAEDILIIDPVEGTAERTDMGLTLSGTRKWSHGAGGTDGKIYAIPRDAGEILIIDPAAGTASLSDMGASMSTGGNKWSGGVPGPDGRIYGIPYNASDVLIIDPEAEAAQRTNMGASLSGNLKWAGGVLGPDGKIYGIPLDGPDILIIDVAAGEAERTNMGVSMGETRKWYGGALAADGRIYGIPRSATNILRIGPFEDNFDIDALVCPLLNNF